MTIKDIFAGIDGTGSHEQGWIPGLVWSRGNVDKPGRRAANSHVYDFYCRLATHGGRKEYFEGPSHVIFGGDVPRLTSQVVEFLKRELRAHPHARVSLVGHSRGGLVAIEAARRMRRWCKVHFLGLYDAVDRTSSVGKLGFRDDIVIENVNVVYHAIRSPRHDGRWYFGYAGTKVSADVREYRPEYFETQHGNLGGGHEKDGRIDIGEMRCAVAAHQRMREMARAAGLTIT